MKTKRLYDSLNKTIVNNHERLYRKEMFGYKIPWVGWFISKNEKNGKCTIYDIDSGIKIFSYTGPLWDSQRQIKDNQVMEKWEKYYNSHKEEVEYLTKVLPVLPTKQELLEEEK